MGFSITNFRKYETSYQRLCPLFVQSTDQELIPARNASQCKVPRVEMMFAIIQRENICPSKKEMNKAITMLITRKCVPTLQKANCPMFAVRL
jgi:hypothetical protein